MEKTNEQIWAKLEEINKMVAQCCKNQLKISEAGKINEKVRNLMQFEPRRDKLMQFEPTWGEFVTCDENEHGRKWIMIWGGESNSGYFTNEIYGYCETLGHRSSGCCCTITGDTFRPSTDAEKKRLLDKLSEEGKVWNPILMRIEDKAVRIEDKKWEPKRGEVVKTDAGKIYIYKEGMEGYRKMFGDIYYYDGKISRADFAMTANQTSSEERGKFFEALTKAGYKWNSKRLELTRREEMWEPNDGEFIVANDGTISILGKKEANWCFNVLCRLYKNGTLDARAYGLYTSDFITRKATEAERQILLDALAKADKTWNAELKRVEDVPVGFKDGCYVTLDEEWVSMYRGVSAVKNAISDYCGTHINHGNFTDLTPATRRCYNSIRPSTQSEISRFNALLSHAKKRAEDSPTKVVELTMEQVCERLGMNVKIVKK